MKHWMFMLVASLGSAVLAAAPAPQADAAGAAATRPAAPALRQWLQAQRAAGGGAELAIEPRRLTPEERAVLRQQVRQSGADGR